MTVQRVSDSRFIWEKLCDLLQSLIHQESNSYSSTVEFVLTELVRTLIRQNAQQTQNQDTLLLEAAIQTVDERLQAAFGDNYSQLDLSPYVESVRKALKYPVREMVELGQRLKRSQREERLSNPRHLMSEAEVPFVVAEVGLQNAVSALVAFPTVDAYGLNLEQIRQDYRLEGDFFPFETHTGEIEFVIDDDGMIFTSVEHLPDHLISDAREELIELASHLYTQGTV